MINVIIASLFCYYKYIFSSYIENKCPLGYIYLFIFLVIQHMSFKYLLFADFMSGTEDTSENDTFFALTIFTF